MSQILNQREFNFKTLMAAAPKTIVDTYDLDAQGSLMMLIGYAALGFEEKEFSIENDDFMDALRYFRDNNSLAMVAHFFEYSSLGEMFLQFTSGIDTDGKPYMTMVTEHNASQRVFGGGSDA